MALVSDLWNMNGQDGLLPVLCEEQDRAAQFSDIQQP